MKALWLEDKVLSLRNDLPDPEPQYGEALIRVDLAGVCSTDLEMVKGYYPFTGILGHEFVGTVLAAPGAPEWEGRRVVGEITLYCGECPDCKRGDTGHCAKRETLGLIGKDGVFAEKLVLPLKNLHMVPDGVPDGKAVFTELLAAALEIPQQLDIKPSDRVAVVGAGRLGLLIAQVLKLSGCELKVLVRREAPGRLLDGWGIPHGPEADFEAGSFDIAVEVTGSPQGFNLSRRLVRPRGTLLLKSTFAGELTLNMSGVVVDEIKIQGSRCGPFDPALRLLAAGLIDVESLITAVYPLDDGLKVIEHAAQPGVLKVLIKP